MRLYDEELELAAACELIAARLPVLAEELAALGQAHIDAAARLRVEQHRRVRRSVSAWTRLRVAMAEWATPEGALGWLRDRELELARHWGSDPRALVAWDRYQRIERLVAMREEAIGY